MAENSFDRTGCSVAPWWHTLVVLAILATGSAASAIQHGMPNAHLPGLNIRMSSYITVLFEEWLLALLVWLALRRRGLGVGFLVSGSWHGATRFAKDLGIAIAFTVIAVPLAGILMYLVRGNSAVLNDIVPANPGELAVWLVLAASAGYCEELVFRGYLMHQFGAWSGSRTAGIILQGAAFGLAHGYYHTGMAVVMVHGCLLGALAQWRRSLRPGMLAHALQDSLGGVAGYFTR